MNSKSLLLIKNKLKKYLRDKNILDIIIFGSFIKGKSLPGDIDIAVICKEKKSLDIAGFHVSVLGVEDFFVKVPSVVHTLFREGYSLKYKRAFSENYKFVGKALFKYELSGLKPSVKVKVVNVLRGKGGTEGLVKEGEGEWLANQIFTVPIGAEHIFEKFFLNFKVKFNKSYILIH